jgi:hypothetical protein
MIYAIVGITDSEDKFLRYRQSGLKGIGKTMFLTWLGAIEKFYGRTVYANYNTAFTPKLSMRESIEDILVQKVEYPTILTTEAHTVLEQYEKRERKDFYVSFVRQVRKLNINWYWDSQIMKDVNKTIRLEVDSTFTTEKFHKKDNSLCTIDFCDLPHYIQVRRIFPKPEFVLPIMIDCEVIGKLYNTNEVVLREN